MRIGDLFNPKGIFIGSFIPDAISKMTSITPTDKLVYGRLMRYAGDNGECYPKQSEIAVECGVSLSAVTKSIANLLRSELLVVIAPTGIERIKHFRNKYFFTWHEVFENCSLRTSKIYLSDNVNFTDASKRVKIKESHIEKELKDKTEETEKHVSSARVIKSFSVFENLKNNDPKDESSEKVIYEFLDFWLYKNGKEHKPLSDEIMNTINIQIENYIDLLSDCFDDRIQYAFDQFFNTRFRQINCDYSLALFGTCVEQLFNRARTKVYVGSDYYDEE